MTLSENQSQALLVLCTVDDLACAQQIAHLLLHRSLAACVSISAQMHSFYRWQDKIEESTEYLLFIKTDAKHYPQLQEEICQCHPYHVPEILAFSAVTGLAAYLDWLHSSLS